MKPLLGCMRLLQTLPTPLVQRIVSECQEQRSWNRCECECYRPGALGEVQMEKQADKPVMTDNEAELSNSRPRQRLLLNN